MPLLEFYGQDCPFCEKMAPLVDQLSQEGFTVHQHEVWHHPANMKKLHEVDTHGHCDGVPFFINTETGKWLCGEKTYKTLKSWAAGEE